MTNHSKANHLKIGEQTIDVGSAVQHLQSLAGAQGGLNVIQQVVGLATLWQSEKSNREVIRAKRDTMIAQIDAQQRLMEQYFEGVFNERRENFDQLYDVLHTALDKEQWDIVDKAMTAVVEIAKEFPLDDLDKFRTAWNDPDGPTIEF